MHKYKVTCLECKAARDVAIVKSQNGYLIDWLDNNPNPLFTKIISGRHRMDGNWGWQCICGNDDLMTEQEKSHIEDWADPKPHDIERITANLKVEEPKFKMKESK